MSMNLSVFLVVAGCALVTFFPRVIPFMVIRTIPLPKPLIKWLQFIPVCILSALVMNSILVKNGTALTVDWMAVIAILPTLFIALWTKSLSITVLAGVILMALVRLI